MFKTKRTTLLATAALALACAAGQAAAQETGPIGYVMKVSGDASVISDGSTNLYNADERWPVIRGDQQKEYYSETKVRTQVTPQVLFFLHVIL